MMRRKTGDQEVLFVMVVGIKKWIFLPTLTAEYDLLWFFLSDAACACYLAYSMDGIPCLVGPAPLSIRPSKAVVET